MLWSFVSSPQPTQGLWHWPGCGGKRRGPALWQLIFLGWKPKKPAQNHLQWPAVWQKGKKKFLELEPRKNLKAIPEVFDMCSEAAPGRPQTGSHSPKLSFGLCVTPKASKQGGCWCSLTASVWLEEFLEWGHLSAPAMHHQCSVSTSVISCSTQSLLFSPLHSNPGLDLTSHNF